jgi:hypothetical protein
MVDFRSEAQSEGPQTTQADLSSALKTDMSDPLAQFKKISGEERAKVSKAESDLVEAQITKQREAAQARADLANKQAQQMTGIMDTYGKQMMTPAPKREIEAQTKEGMMGLAALLPVAGAFFGGKGLTSATGAMQAMTGLVKGYQEGNQNRIAFEQKKYDDAMKEFDRHQQQIKTAFDMAIKKAQVNQSGAQAELEIKLAALDAPLLREMVKKNGIVAGAEENIKMAQNYYTHKQQYEEKLNIAREVAGIRAEAPTAKAKGVQSERETAKPYFNNADLGEKAPAVIGVAKVMGEAADLAQMVQDNPYLVGRTGQAREIKQRLFDSIRNGKPIPEDLQNSSDANVQDAVLFAKKFASFRTRYEQALAGSGKGFTVALQNQYNKLLDPNQFNPQSFVDLMKDLSKEAASGVTGVNKEITYDRLMNYGIDISERAGFEKARSGSTLLKTAPSAEPYSAAEIEKFSKQYNKSIDEIKKGLRDRGLKIEGE